MSKDSDQDELNQDELNPGDSTDTNLSHTYTQIASCVIGAEFVEHRRQSLRAKLEREHYEHAKQHQQSLTNSFRNLFGLTR